MNMNNPEAARTYVGLMLASVPFDPEQGKRAYAMLDAELAKGASINDSIHKVAELIGFKAKR